ncbi:MAG: tetratricopeptide repeat protein [Pseudomonadota bacterium]
MHISLICNQAVIQSRLREFSQAEKAIALALDLLGENWQSEEFYPLQLAQILNDWAEIKGAKEYEKAETNRSYIPDLSECFAIHEKALNLREANGSHDDPILVESRNNIGQVLSRSGNYEDALAYFDKAKAIADGPFMSRFQPSFINVLNNNGMCLVKAGFYHDGRQEIEAALQIALQHFNPTHPVIGKIKNNLASI